MDCEYVSELLTTALESISLPVRPFPTKRNENENDKTPSVVCLRKGLLYVCNVNVIGPPPPGVADVSQRALGGQVGSYLTVIVRGGQTIPPGENITSHPPSPSSLLQTVEHNMAQMVIPL